MIWSGTEIIVCGGFISYVVFKPRPHPGNILGVILCIRRPLERDQLIRDSGTIGPVMLWGLRARLFLFLSVLPIMVFYTEDMDENKGRMDEKDLPYNLIYSLISHPKMGFGALILHPSQTLTVSGGTVVSVL